MITLLSFFSPRQSQKMLLLGGSLLVVIGSIILQNTGVFPLDGVTFLFFSFVTLLAALYRPSSVFLFFIAVLPLETINIAPALAGGVMLRPYQWLTVILLLAVATRFFSGRLPFRLFRWQWFDIFPVLIVIGAFIALVNAPVVSLAVKQALVVTSFVAVYFLGRIFFRTIHDVYQALPFFLVSSLAVLGYALWQNIRAFLGQESFQVMIGRPNATFAEADWLGMFVLLVLGAALIILFRSLTPALAGVTKKYSLIKKVLATLFLTGVFTVLMVTVARSAWIGALGLVGVFLLGVLSMNRTNQMKTNWRRTVPLGLSVGGSFLLALVLIAVFHLSPFQLFNRIQSTGGFQEITIACEQDSSLPVAGGRITDMAQLSEWHCRHIMLEEVELEQRAGRFVSTVYRDDPNVSIRKQIYTRVGNILVEHPLLGIGWGSASFFLGSDERGAGLNASNVFFEVWLGSGILGLVAFVLFLSALFWASWQWYRESENETEQLFSLFLFSTLLGMIVFDLFNSGILLGFFFIFLSLGTLALETKGVLVRVNK